MVSFSNIFFFFFGGGGGGGEGGGLLSIITSRPNWTPLTKAN